jgi:hypothetical protein
MTMDDATQAAPLADIAHALCDYRAVVQAIGQAIATLVAEVDCAREAAGIRVLLANLGDRLEERIDQIERLVGFSPPAL